LRADVQQVIGTIVRAPSNTLYGDEVEVSGSAIPFVR